MSFADEAEFAEFIGRDHKLPTVTPEAVSGALEGFGLPLLPGKDIDWLAMAVRRSLAISIPIKDYSPDRKSNAEIRKEINALADTVHSAWTAVLECSREADSRLWSHAYRHWEGVNAMIANRDKAFAYNQFRTVVANMEWLAGFLRQAARETQRQVGPWRQSEERRLRVERGRYLAPIFEAAFGQQVSVNNWPSGVHRDPSAFMDFYQRMVALAFGERATPDISGVLKTSCQLHKQNPTEYAEGIIPGL